MIYSIKNNFLFLHCPRTSGTAISKSLAILVPDAKSDLMKKHGTHDEISSELKSLRAFTVLRPLEEVRTSYYYYLRKWYSQEADNQLSTRWLIEHAQRISTMSLREYLASNEPPVSVDGYSRGCSAVFQYHEQPYDSIAEFCGVNSIHFRNLMDIFRGAVT